jgi:hypothetical protein
MQMPNLNFSLLHVANLAVLSALGIPDSEARDTILVMLGIRLIQEGKSSISAGLRVVGGQQLLETSASSEIVLKGDVLGKVGRAVQGAGALSVIA